MSIYNNCIQIEYNLDLNVMNYEGKIFDNC